MQVVFEAPLSRRLADRADQIIAACLYVWLCSRFLNHGLGEIRGFQLMLVASEGVVLVFLLIRRSTDKVSLNPRDWIVAYGATLLPLLVVNPETLFLPQVGLVVMLIGFFLQLAAKLNLWRSFGIVPADRGLQSLGFYGVVRHPMYLGYMITHAGLLVAAPSGWNAALYAITWGLLVSRVFREERFLSANPEYRAYCSKVPYRLIPGVL